MSATCLKRFSRERLNRIVPKMMEYVSSGRIPGVVTLLALDEEVIHLQAAGYRFREAQAPMTVDTIFRIASMTKPVVSVAAMTFWEEGAFLLSDPVERFIAEFKDPVVAVASGPLDGGTRPFRLLPSERPITMHHLFTHTAGLANGYRGPFTQKAFLEASRRKGPDETIGDFVIRLARLPLNFHPGQAWEYSRATCVLGRVLEVISGKTLDEILKERIFDPLKMKDTHFFLPRTKLDRLCAAYRPKPDGALELTDRPNEESPFVAEPHCYFMGSGGLLSTAGDYWRFCHMLLNGGELEGVRILAPSTVRMMTRNHTGDLPIWLGGPGVGFGLGFAVVINPTEAVLLRGRYRGPLPWSEGTYGWGGAFCTHFWIDPVEYMVGILLTQVRPYRHLDIREVFITLAYQALVNTRV